MKYLAIVFIVIVFYVIIDRICQCIEIRDAIKKGFIQFENTIDEEKKDV